MGPLWFTMDKVFFPDFPKLIGRYEMVEQGGAGQDGSAGRVTRADEAGDSP